jgi:uncharacterized delta-60 repeat protein
VLSDEAIRGQIKALPMTIPCCCFIKEKIMQKLKTLLGILAIGLITAVTLSAQNSGSFQGQAIQPDGKILIWGSNIVVSGVPAGMIARLNSNGSRDGTFNFCGCGFIGVNYLLLQPDGKILVSGNQDPGSIFIQGRIARINADGSSDNTFTPYQGSSAPSAFLTLQGLQPDGKILAGNYASGGFPFGASMNVIRLNPNGSRDNPFSIFVGSGYMFMDYLGAIEVLPDGKFYVGIEPGYQSGTATLKRYNADGSLDPTWAAPAFPQGINNINSLDSQPNGDLLVAGGFNQINGVSVKNIARLTSAGVVDTTFIPPDTPIGVYQINVLPDGKFLILERLTTSSPSIYAIRRLNANGSLDGTFVQSPSITSVNGAFSVDALGRIVFIGNHATRGNGYYRLNPNGDLDETFKFGFNQTDFDFDGDGRSDVGVFRPSEGNWYLSQSLNGFSSQNFGLPGDVITPGDYDGDNKTDLSVFRPSTGVWWYKSTINNGYYAVSWGQAGDIPLAEDFNGDGRSDFVIFRPANSTWYRLGSNGQYAPIVFGTAGDIPLVADMNGDGKADPTIYRPSTGTWWYANSINGLFYAIQWGTATDIPVPGDYDGDGSTDPAYFRPSNGAWYILLSGTNYTTSTATAWGTAGDRPTPADYDGDGKTDLAIYRPSNGMWFALRSTSGFFSQQFGLVGDKAVENAFLP